MEKREESPEEAAKREYDAEVQQTDRDNLADAIKHTPKHGPKRRNRPLTVTERIEAFHKIVTEKQAARVEGVLVDGFSASMVVQVYDALNEHRRTQFMDRPAKQVVLLGWKIVKAAEGRK